MKIDTFIGLCLGAVLLFSCYEDLGNYDYREINELAVTGIRDTAVDVDDLLCYYPVLQGTQYSDTSRFTYEWEVGNTIVSTEKDLEWIVNVFPGTKICRYIVKDKETEVKQYFSFTLNVSSSTAGDLIMVLSKYNGKAELSYQRLDKPASFVVNYFEERFEDVLGTNPQQLQIVYTEASRCYPFTNAYGRVMVLTDNKIRLIDKGTLMPDTTFRYLEGAPYTGNASYPPADIDGYHPEYLFECIYLWRKSAYGDSYQQMNCFGQISGGTFYSAILAPSVWSPSYYYKNSSPYTEGYLSAFAFFDDMSPTPNSNLIQLGYSTGNLLVFDKRHGRFAYGSMYGSIASIPETEIRAFPGYDLVYGCPTSIANNTSFVVLSNGSDYRLALISRASGSTYKLEAEMGAGAVINASTRFAVMKYNEYIFFATGGKLYRYNMLDLASGMAPGERNVVMNLSDRGYGSEASITDICISRSERTLLVGVSRYGSDTEAMGNEAKGDLLHFDLNAATLDIQYNDSKSYRGVSGIPVDIQIKYQTHWRDGFYIDGTMRDNI